MHDTVHPNKGVCFEGFIWKSPLKCEWCIYQQNGPDIKKWLFKALNVNGCWWPTFYVTKQFLLSYFLVRQNSWNCYIDCSSCNYSLMGSFAFCHLYNLSCYIYIINIHSYVFYTIRDQRLYYYKFLKALLQSIIVLSFTKTCTVPKKFPNFKLFLNLLGIRWYNVSNG